MFFIRVLLALLVLCAAKVLLSMSLSAPPAVSEYIILQKPNLDFKLFHLTLLGDHHNSEYDVWHSVYSFSAVAGWSSRWLHYGSPYFAQRRDMAI